MNDIHAIIVGIERYDQHDWDITGPCLNAIRMAKRVNSLGVKENNIYLFTNINPENHHSHSLEKILAALQENGVAIHEPCHNKLDSCIRDLPQRATGEARLFFYWSGHGYTDGANQTSGDRVLICSDFTTNGYENRVLNINNQIEYLRTVRFSKIREQFFLTDVCATKPPVRLGKDEPIVADPQDDIVQIGLFAAQEGEYSRGGFSKVILSELKGISEWPNLEDFSTNAIEKLKFADVSPFYFDYRSKSREIVNIHGGSIENIRPDKLTHNIFNFLRTLDFSISEFRHHYLRTIADLGMPDAASDSGILGMIRDLLSFDTGINVGQRSAALEEFLMRLAHVPIKGDSVKNWLNENPEAHLNSTRASILEKFGIEDEKKILVVEMETRAGVLTSFSTFVCRSDCSRLTEWTLLNEQVKTWDEFEERISYEISRIETGGVEIGQIEFFVDATLFDRAFNLINGPDGDPIGHNFPVVIRWRRKIAFKHFWRSYSEELHNMRHIEAVELPEDHAEITRLINDKKGLFYPCFEVGDLTRADKGKVRARALMQLVRSGAPYAVWLRATPKCGEQSVTEVLHLFLTNHLKAVGKLEMLPTAIHGCRFQYDEVAENSTILWDDPRLDPFNYVLRGMKRETGGGNV